MQAMKVPTVNSQNIKGIIREHVSKDATMMTDKYTVYQGLDKDFAGHGVVDHGTGEYVRGDVHTNMVDGWFSLLKRGITGTFHHVSEEHLGRYVDEFAFRYNNREITDAERTAKSLSKI